MEAQADLYRELPGVDELLREPEIITLAAQHGHAATSNACRIVLGHLREEIAGGHLDTDSLRLALSGIPAAIKSELDRALAHSLKPVINATGVVLHTNLGRAPIATSAIEHIREIVGSYSNLEFDLESGERGKRDMHVDRLFQKLLSDDLAGQGPAARARTPAPPQSLELEGTGVPDRAPTQLVSTIVVNNNAAAVLLALNTLADGGEVIVSRGELVEIGGSFRIPDVMSKSGAILREVGTTNRTRISDYERAMNERTKLLLRVHRSNFEITGFTERPALDQLASLAERHKLPLMEDLGSGALFDLGSIGINDEPGVLDSLRAGVHVVTYSGDKLLGGPQAGVISGREDLVRKMRNNSLFRALRVDKLTYAALEATLLAYVKHDYNSIPTLRMMQISQSEIARRAKSLLVNLETRKLQAEIIKGESLIGGGAAPSAVLPTVLIAIQTDGFSANEFAARLRASNPPVITRVEDGRVLLDLRTVFPEQDEVLKQALVRAAAS